MNTYPCRRHGRIIVLLLMLPLVVPLIFRSAVAQTPPPPIVPMHGVGDDEFLVSSNVATYPDSGGIGKLWDFARAMGVTTLMPGANFEQIDTLSDPTVRNPENRLIIRGIEPVQLAGAGRDVQFYPFDSVQVPMYKWLFTDKNGGTDFFNTGLPVPDPPRERRYNSSNTSPGQLILNDVAYNWHPGQTNRFPAIENDPTAHNASDFIDWYRYRWQTNGKKPTFNIVVTGHLIESNGSANDNDSLLKIEVVYEIPAGKNYELPAGVPHQAEADTSYIYTTVYVKKASLAPPSSPTPNYNLYRDTSIAINFAQCAGCPPGPMYEFNEDEFNESRRFNLRVYWTGAEAVALRSVALRDSIGELVMGNRQPSVDFRDNMLSAARRVVYGTTTPDSTAEPREAILRIMSGIEQHPMESSMFAAVEDLLRKNLRTGFTPGDSISCHTEGGTTLAGVPAFHHLTYSDAVYPEIGFATPVDTSIYYTSGDESKGNEHRTFQREFNLDIVRVPSIAQHNGDRFQIPLLNLTRQAIESDYEPAVQIVKLGHYDPRGLPYPWNSRNISNLAQGAEIMRDKGRRMISTVFPTSELHLRIKAPGDPLDTMMSHTPEAAELRAIVNLSLCYGARGIHYYWLGNYTNHMERSRLDSNVWVGVNDSWGPNGPLTDDTTLNHSPLFHLTDNVPAPGYPLGTPRVSINDFYVGYQVRTRETKAINRWLAAIGPEMAKLRWRDAYSMHAAVPHPNLDSNRLTPRPLPSTEIVTMVRAQAPDSTFDAPAATYVELGLFQKQVGRDTSNDNTVTLNPMKDVHHLFVVNRRTFERPDDISPASDSGRIMDTLAETRRVFLHLNLEHPLENAIDGYNYVHVKEIAPDTTRLAFQNVPRSGLDTIVHADSAFALWLRPGGGALLRVKYCPPGDTIGPGDTRFNNQKKLVFDGRYYHAVYWRKASNPAHKDTIYYRRSMPVADSTGAVSWDPFEYRVAPDNTLINFENDCFPSLTVRVMPSDTTVTIVWTNRSKMVVAPRRNIYLRRFTWLSGGSVWPSLIEPVGVYEGADPEKWGTPVVSALHGGELIAWSDSLVGIVARLRRGSTTYGTPDTLLHAVPNQSGAGSYPSMPPFAHVQGRDSSIAIVWQQPAVTFDDPNGSRIMYMRLVDTVTASGDMLLKKNVMQLSQNDATRHLHPSIDMTQDAWYGAQEGVSWESVRSIYDPLKDLFYTRTWVHFSSIWTSTSGRYNHAMPGYLSPHWDSIGPAWQWTYNKAQVVNAPGWLDPKFVYPSVGSQNWRNDTIYRDEKIYFGVSLGAVPGMYGMRQALVQYATAFLWSFPWLYDEGGFYPSTSSAPVRQGNRTAALYQLSDAERSTLNTSRQFFAKGVKPLGYVAHGRQMHLPIDPVTGTAITAVLNDVWVAGAASSGPVLLAERPDSLRRTDSMDTVAYLFTSRPFAAHDSTTIGLELMGYYVGDTASGAGMRVDYIAELVNTTSGEVVHRFDSFTVEPGGDAHANILAADLDLLSGTYVVRLRIEPCSLQVADLPYASRYPVEEMTSYVEDENGFGKLRRVERSADAGRISAWPNPAGESAAIRFSVPVAAMVSVRLYDAGGRHVLRPVEPAQMEPGRYTLTIDTGELQTGTYLLELRYGTRRVVEKIIVKH